MKFALKKSILFLIIIGISFCAGFQQTANAQMIYPGEDLLYEVSFLGIKLGSIRMRTEDFQMHDGKKVCKAKSNIDSYKGIPFVDLHTIYESWFDQSVSFSYKFNGHTKENDYWLFDQLFFDYDKGEIGFEKWKKTQKYYGNVVKNNKKMNDGLSVFFFARQFAKTKQYIKIPTLIDRDISATYINFLNKKENVEIDAVNYPVRTVYFNGKSDWQGVYGLNGTFEGWFSDDEASIPIKAKMTVYVGSVKLELVKWKRGSWAPPRG